MEALLHLPDTPLFPDWRLPPRGPLILPGRRRHVERVKRRAMVPVASTVLTGNASPPGSGDVTTASMSIGATEIGVMAISAYEALTGDNDYGHFALTGWTAIGSAVRIRPGAGSIPIGMKLFYRAGSFSGTQTITQSAHNDYILWQCIKITNVITTSPTLGTPPTTTITAGTSASVSFGTAPLLSNCLVYCAGDYDVRTLTPRSGFTALYNDPNPNIGTLMLAFRNNGNDTAISVTASSSTALGLLGTELQVLKSDPLMGARLPPYAILVQ